MYSKSMCKFRKISHLFKHKPLTSEECNVLNTNDKLCTIQTWLFSYSAIYGIEYFFLGQVVPTNMLIIFPVYIKLPSWYKMLRGK